MSDVHQQLLRRRSVDGFDVDGVVAGSHDPGRGRRERAALLVLILLAACTMVVAVAFPARATGSYDNASIADKALQYVGQWGGNACNDAQKPGDSGGQCRAFVNCIVWMTSGHSQNLGGSDYYQPFLDAGGVEIRSLDDLRKGDIVQIGQGVHTTIIVSRVSGSTFNVVDSNHDYHETVMNYNRSIALDGSYSRAFRLGTTAGTAPSSISVSNNAGTMSVQLANFATGTAHFFCHTGSPAAYPTGGSVSGQGSVAITAPNQAWSSGWCAGDGNYWLGVQAPDGRDYYSNQVTLGTVPASITATNNNGQMAVQLANFPTGTANYFCHSGSAADYPAGGSVSNRGSMVVVSPNQFWAAGWCAGSGIFWVGIQAPDGHDYYSNQVTLSAPVTAPSAPTNVQAVAATASASVSWTAPSSDGGLAVAGYTVTASPGGSACATTGAFSCEVTGLVNGTAYSFTVTATNGVGTSPASIYSNTVTPAGVPAPPANVSAYAYDGWANVTWSVAESNGSAITGYTVTASPGGLTANTSTADLLPTTVDIHGLTNGTTYTFSVRATNALGTGPASLPSNAVTPHPTTACSVPSSAPLLGFYTGSALSSGTSPAMPIVATWGAATGTTCTYELQREDSITGLWATVYAGAVRNYKSSSPINSAHSTFRVRAVDGGGHQSAWATGITTVVDGTQEPSASYSGTFATANNSSYYGGTATSTVYAGASATTGYLLGQSLAVIGTKCAGCGSFQLYVDNVLKATVSEYASTTTYRSVLAQVAVPRGAHTLKLVNLATAGHPMMIIDGFADIW